VFVIVYLVSAAILIFLILFYQRNVPVKGIDSIPLGNLHGNDHFYLDLREYNDAETQYSSKTLQIPYAYLGRFYKEIPKGPIHIIAGDRFDLHLGIRFLKRKGFTVSSFTLLDGSEQTSVIKTKMQKCGEH